MNNMQFRFVLIFFLFLLTLPLRAAPQMVVGLDRTTVYEGEPLLYWITLTDSQPIDDSVTPDVSAITDFNVQTLPKRPSSHRSIQINNGKQTDTTIISIRYAYVLTPKKGGSLSIPEPKVLVDGQTLKPDSLEIGGQTARNIPLNGAIPITVRQPNDQDLVFMKIEADRLRLYPFQLLTITLIVQVKGLPEKIDTGQSPLQVLRDPPRLSIPWAHKDDSLPKGIIPVQELNDWLSGLNVRRSRSGFAINNYSTDGFGIDDDWFRSPLSLGGMMRRSLYQFSPQPKQIKRPNASGQETAYWEFRFVRTFRPEEIGKFSFGPVTLKGAFAAADENDPKGATAMDVYAVAPEIQVDVADVPQENRPESYIGAFGTFKWSVDLQPRQAKIGDPMTLTLRLTGQGSTADIQAPDLSLNQEIAANFKVYPPTEEVNDKSCTFTYTIRPTKAGGIIFPSLPVAFFDVERERFESLQSEPIPLEILEAKTLQTPQAFGSPSVFSGNLQRSEKGLFANMTDPRSAVNQSVNYVRWAAVMVSLPIIYSVLALGVFIWQKRQSDPKLRRRRGAFSRARQRLSEVIESVSGSNSLSEPGNLLQCVFLGYIADLTNGIEHGMTTKDACLKCLELGVTEKTVSEVRRLLETLDAARYGGLDLSKWDELTAEGNVLLKRLQDEMTLSARR